MIQIDVISGFLGAGKTTLIKKLAAALTAAGEKVAVVENEFGEAGIDGTLLSLEGIKVYEIENGCICCTLKDDFVRTLAALEKAVSVDRVLIEPSGIFVMNDLEHLLADELLAGKFSLHSVVTVVDCARFLRQRRRYGPFFESQIRRADTVALTKTEQVSPDDMLRAMDEILAIHPQVRIAAADAAELDEAAARDLLQPTEENAKADLPPLPKRRVKRHQDFSAFSLRPRGVWSEDAVRSALGALCGEEYGRILRAKGFFRGDGTGYEFHVVDGSFAVTLISGEADAILSVIGESLDKDGLRALIER